MPEVHEYKTAVQGTALEIIEYLKSRRDQGRYLLTEEPAPSHGSLSIAEEEELLDELGNIARGRLQPSVAYNREDIYFDHD